MSAEVEENSRWVSLRIFFVRHPTPFWSLSVVHRSLRLLLLAHRLVLRLDTRLVFGSEPQSTRLRDALFFPSVLRQNLMQLVASSH